MIDLDRFFYKVCFFCLSIFVLQTYAEWNTNDYMKREHSLIKPYHDTSWHYSSAQAFLTKYGVGVTIPNWDFIGSTMVTHNHVRLTKDDQSLQGAIWNNLPCFVKNWELQIHFKIHGRGKDLFGDGMAIWYAKERMKPGEVFGYSDFFHGLAIFLDTYSNHNGEHNHQHPYISGMVNNGTLHYDHDRDGTHTQLAGCEAKFRNLDHDTHVAIRYHDNTLTVSTDIENKAAWKECFVVRGIQLPTGYYFGVSAATGDLSDNHDIMSIRLYELDMPEDAKDDIDRTKIIPSASFYEPPRERIEDTKPSMSGVKTFFLMLLAAIGIIVIAVIGIMMYQKHQENARKRFY